MSHASIAIWQVDAFTDTPFRGNPAAVCILDSYPSDAWMQSLAAEMNLSETAFAVPTQETNNFQLRWFTPAAEVDLCGHATLATTHVLLEQQRVDRGKPIRFQSLSGELICTQIESDITLDFPATPAAGDVEPDIAFDLLAALGIQEAKVLRSAFDLVVIADDSNTVELLNPDFSLLEQIEARGVIVTAASYKPEFDFVSRFFAPRCGINEDPVTGSAHCCIAPYWAQRLNKLQLVGFQASQRGGVVQCEVIAERVRLTGRAITILEGRLHIEPE